MYQNNEDIRDEFVYRLNNEEFVVDKTGVKTLEIINANFQVTEPTIFGKRNEDYIKREIEWYESQSLFVQDIPGETPKIWKQVASNIGVINSNYGYLVYSNDQWNQFDNVVKELNKNPDSRRANMIYTRPAIWQDAFVDDMSDFICTNNVQYFIRDNKLITSVNMRSNDVVFGFNNDYAWQTHIRNKLHAELDVTYELGPIYWNVGSLHIYERHFNLIKEWQNKFDEEVKQQVEELKSYWEEERKKELTKQLELDLNG